MALLLLFSFLAGVVTILSPCILPILPIVLSSSLGTTKSYGKPVGTIVGFVFSFTFFTLFISSIVRFLGVPSDTLRLISVVIIGIFGVTYLIPSIQMLFERMVASIPSLVNSSSSRSDFWGGIMIGLSLGLVWTPCVGPILASVITLALAGEVTAAAVFITLAYSLGTAVPMFLIMIGGRKLLLSLPWVTNNTVGIQRMFGVLMILTSLAIYTNADRRFQVYILDTFPQYAQWLTQLEDVPHVQDALPTLPNN